MRLSDRLREQGVAPPDRMTVPPSAGTRHPHDDVLLDAVAELKTRAHDALFARLGVRLFDSTLTEEQLNAYVAREITELMSSSPVPFTLLNTIAPGRPSVFIARSNSVTEAAGSLSGSVASDRKCWRSFTAAANALLMCFAISTAVAGSSKCVPGVVKVITCLSTPCFFKTPSR